MGYYSDVVIAASSEAAKVLDKAISSVSFKPQKRLERGEGKDREVIYEWYYVKWYSQLSEINAIEEALSMLDEYDADTEEYYNYGYQFIRVGEEVSDIETRNNTWEMHIISPMVAIEIENESDFQEV